MKGNQTTSGTRVTPEEKMQVLRREGGPGHGKCTRVIIIIPSSAEGASKDSGEERRR